MIFSDNGANQTADLYRCGEGWYDGTWHDDLPVASDLIVHFKPNTYSNPKIYFWNVDNGQTTTWPGVDMQNDGNGWYSYTFVGANCANFIFSNNGANQTGDLYSCEEFWLENPASRGGFSHPFLIQENGSKIRSDQWITYPNPFNDELNVELNLEFDEPVIMEVFDIHGRKIRELLNGNYAKGIHQFQFKTNLQEGWYILQLSTSQQRMTKKIVVVQ